MLPRIQPEWSDIESTPETVVPEKRKFSLLILYMQKSPPRARLKSCFCRLRGGLEIIMTNKTKRILTILLVTVAIAAFAITPLAWFAYYWVTNQSAFTPGYNSVMPDVTMWMYLAEADITDEGLPTTTPEGWYQVDDDDIKIKDPNIVIPSVIDQSTNTTFKYSYKSLHFGKVDNLVDLREDNKVYLRFQFNTGEHGKNVLKINLDYATSGYSYEGASVLDSIYLYDLTSNDKTTAKFDLKEPIDKKGDTNNPRYTIEYDETRPGAMQFLQYKYVISKEEMNPIEDDFNALFKNIAAVPIGCGRPDGDTCNTCHCTNKAECTLCPEGFCYQCDACYTCNCTKGRENCDVCKVGRCSECISCTACSKEKCGYVVMDDPTSVLLEKGETAYNGDYYLYIELAPRLDAFGMQENILDYFVPSYMFFDVKFDIEIG